MATAKKARKTATKATLAAQEPPKGPWIPEWQQGKKMSPEVYAFASEHNTLERDRVWRDEGGRRIYSEGDVEVATLELADGVLTLDFLAARELGEFYKVLRFYEPLPERPGWLRFRRPAARDPRPALVADLGSMLGAASWERRNAHLWKSVEGGPALVALPYEQLKDWAAARDLEAPPEGREISFGKDTPALLLGGGSRTRWLSYPWGGLILRDLVGAPSDAELRALMAELPGDGWRPVSAKVSKTPSPWWIFNAAKSYYELERDWIPCHLEGGDYEVSARRWAPRANLELALVRWQRLGDTTRHDAPPAMNSAAQPASIVSGGGPYLVLSARTAAQWKGYDEDNAAYEALPYGADDGLVIETKAGRSLLLGTPDTLLFVPHAGGGSLVRVAASNADLDTVPGKVAALREVRWTTLADDFVVDGGLIAIDAAASGADLAEALTIDLPKGTYVVASATARPDGETILQIVRLSLAAGDEPTRPKSSAKAASSAKVSRAATTSKAAAPAKAARAATTPKAAGATEAAPRASAGQVTRSAKDGEGLSAHLVFSEGNSDKFWAVEVKGATMTVTYGRRGTSGTTSTKAFDSAAQCAAEARKLIDQKRRKGYVDG